MVAYLRSSAVLAFTLVGALFLVSCGDDDPVDPDPDPTTGTVQVTVNSGGSGVAGVTVNRYATGSGTIAQTATTGADGSATFADVPEGAWDVGIEVPEDFVLDAGEEARKSVTVVAGGTATASFAVVDTFEGETVDATPSLTFDPDALTISAGTSVRWVNTANETHNVTPDGNAEWTAASLNSNGATFTHTFDTPGTFDYECTLHAGMTGTITVN